MVLLNVFTERMLCRQDREDRRRRVVHCDPIRGLRQDEGGSLPNRCLRYPSQQQQGMSTPTSDTDLPTSVCQLLADDFARNGYLTIVPDYLRGDPIPENALDAPGKFDIGTWFARHGDDVWREDLDKVVAALKTQGVTRFGTTGYCYGAPPAFYLAYNNISAVTVISHPSLLKPESIEVRAGRVRGSRGVLTVVS